MMAREKEFLRRPGSKEDQVLSAMEARGGAVVGIVFDHILNDDEILRLEATFGIRFSRFDGRVQGIGPWYSVVIPWEQIVPVAHLPEVKTIETSAWPPGRPAK